MPSQIRHRFEVSRLLLALFQSRGVQATGLGELGLWRDLEALGRRPLPR
jgi:hypothetical protein